MNFKEAFFQGQRGENKGLPMGDGLELLSNAINGVQRGKIFSIAAGPKVGKSTLADYGFVASPAIYAINNNSIIRPRLESIVKKLEVTTDFEERNALNAEYEKIQKNLIDLEIIYNSFEIDRVSKEFDFMAYFLHIDYNIYKIMLPEGKTCKEKDHIYLSAQYLRGEVMYDQLDADGNKEIILVSDELNELIKTTYFRRIVPLFGEYDSKGNQLSKGIIIFRENKSTAKGIRNYLIEYAKENGEFVFKETVKDKETTKELVGYKAKNPNKYTIIITDHIRKILIEKGGKIKDAIDDFSQYAVELRNLCNFSFVHIVHLNRAMSNVERRKLEDDKIFPAAEDVKDSGNLSEDSNYVITMFNPNDDKYNLKSHFGTKTRASDNSLLFPFMRTLHLVESRHCLCPQHFRVNMFGGVKNFKKFSQ